MTCFKNENILKLIISSIILFEARFLLKKVNSSSLSLVILKILNYEAMVKSLGKTRRVLMNIDRPGTSFALLPDENIITGRNGLGKLVWDINTYSQITTIYGCHGTLHTLDNERIAVIYRNQINIILPKYDFECVQSIDLNGYSVYHQLLSFFSNRFLAVSVFKNKQPFFIVLDFDNDYKIIKHIRIEKYGYLPFAGLHKAFASGNDDIISIWDTEENYTCIKELKEHSGLITSLISTNDYLISGSFDKNIKIWEIRNDYKCIKTIGNGHRISDLVLLRKGYFISYSVDNRIRIWSLVSFNRINEFLGPMYGISSIALLRDDRIITKSLDKLIIWNY
jgi:WD40 repeat protein